MSDSDQYADWDAAYVLGALSGGARAEYEEHLAGCGRCRTAVAELAGLPGLLGQLSPGEAIAVESASDAVLDGPGSDAEHLPEPPPSLMPVLPEGSARRQRWLAPLAAAAAALLIGGVGGYAASLSRDAEPGSGPSSTVALTARRLAFAPVMSSPITAVVDVVPTPEGTELRVECQYAAGPTTVGSSSSPVTGSETTGGSGTTGPRVGEGGYTGIRYAVWVVGRDGRQMEVKDWVARTGRVMHPTGVTAWQASQIAAIEIRLADTNAAVMRARVS